MPNTKTANGSSRLAIQRPVRTVGELLFRSLELIVSGLGWFVALVACGLQHDREGYGYSNAACDLLIRVGRQLGRLRPVSILGKPSRVVSNLASLTLCRSIQLLSLVARGDGATDLELLVLGHQRTVRRRQLPPPRLEPADRALIDPVSRVLPSSRWSCLLVQPETLLGWHRRMVRRRLDLPAPPDRPATAGPGPPAVDRPAGQREPHLGRPAQQGRTAAPRGWGLGDRDRCHAWPPWAHPGTPARCRHLAGVAGATKPLGSSPATWFPVDTVWLGRLEVRCFIELDSRRVHLAGVTANPDGGGVPQPARNLLGVLGTTAGGGGCCSAIGTPSSPAAATRWSAPRWRGPGAPGAGPTAYRPPRAGWGRSAPSA
jgi:hypothetical protein